MSMESFNPAAMFLLDMNWRNLFEEVGTQGIFRCKGCEAEVPRHEREKHFNHHNGIRKRQETMRQKRIKRERVARLARAREAK